MKKQSLKLDGKSLNIEGLSAFVEGEVKRIKLDKKTLIFAADSHSFLSQSIEQNSKIIYGVNTGFGPMANYILAHEQILGLQKNLILSHAVGMGEKIADKFVLAAMLVRLNTLLRGYSGVSVELLENLQKFINLRITPIVPEHGAVGTSGDLVQLAHIALAMLGKGEAVYKNKIEKVPKLLKSLGLKPYQLKPKEGLSLINGTSVMTGIAALVCQQSKSALSLATRNACLALEIIKAYKDSFSEKLHELRPHVGQVIIAQKMREILTGSPFLRSRIILASFANQSKKVLKINEFVQEIYSLRCTAQILGPVYDTLASAAMVTETEMNSVTDNPIVDFKNKKFLHGGNFHGDYIAVAMDQLKMSLVKLTMLSERRLNFFLNQKINQTFPPFLNLHTPGLTLGLQALQFVATSTTAQSQTLAYPANLHSISTNGDNQDVVSMGTDAALLTSKVLDNAFIVLAIESLALCQAADFLKIKNQLSKASRELYRFVRSVSKKIVEDREVQPQLQLVLKELRGWKELNVFEKL